jgi:GTP cyclohydrolase I
MFVEPDIHEDLNYTYKAVGLDAHEYGASLVDTAEYLLARVAGLDVNNPQERDTPRRLLDALREMTTAPVFDFTTFDVDPDFVNEMIVEKSIQFASLCRHHIFPFMGVCHVAYVPNGKIAGLSKIPRLVDQCAHKLMTQEELTAQIAHELMRELKPLGVGVIMDAQHTCMAIRGAKALGVTTRTASMLGVFGDHSRTAKMEFLEAIR